MKLVRETGDGVYRVRAYEPGRVTINEAVYESGLILSLDSLYHPWPVTEASSLSAADLAPALELDPGILLLGTGDAQRFPPREVMRDILGRGVGVEVMDTASACRTFNVLMSEGRRIVAALII